MYGHGCFLITLCMTVIYLMLYVYTLGLGPGSQMIMEHVGNNCVDTIGSRVFTWEPWQNMLEHERTV